MVVYSFLPPSTLHLQSPCSHVKALLHFQHQLITQLNLPSLNSLHFLWLFPNIFFSISSVTLKLSMQGWDYSGNSFSIYWKYFLSFDLWSLTVLLFIFQELCHSQHQSAIQLSLLHPVFPCPLSQLSSISCGKRNCRIK